MYDKIRSAFEYEMQRAKVADEVGDHALAFHHLERAHIIGQRRTILHMRSHSAMLRHGLRARDGREMRGQLLRLVAALVFTRIWVPLGNTGGANVSPVEPMPVPEDLKPLFIADKA